MKTLSLLFIILFLIFITACSNEKEVVVEKSSQKLSEDNVFKGYESALDKANGVEKTILDSADARKKEMESQGY
jgi:hypothetical protein